MKIFRPVLTVIIFSIYFFQFGGKTHAQNLFTDKAVKSSLPLLLSSSHLSVKSGSHYPILYAGISSSRLINTIADYEPVNQNMFRAKNFSTIKKFVIANAPKVENNIIVKLSPDSDETEQSTREDESFFTEELLYFVGAAALATTFYLVWSDGDRSVNKKTFGTPPKP